MVLLSFQGFIRDIRYSPVLPSKIQTYDLANFDINSANTFGVINLDSTANNLAFSKWVSPKRTRSYPFARIYNTYHLNTKRITVIPIIKDEGLAGDNDRLNFITFSWMNLLNVYIVLAWYEDADPVKQGVNKISKQRFNADYVRDKISEIASYQFTALHWNTTHFQRDFNEVYIKAVNSYERIAQTKGVNVHSKLAQIKVLESFQINNKFSLDNFKNFTLLNSLNAAKRESLTNHKLEYLADGTKGIFTISNYLGGQYYLTIDEIYQENNFCVLQESKNSSGGKLPAIDDIKDGLFKLILFSNLDTLLIGDEKVNFIARLKITGMLIGSLSLPTDILSVQNFCLANRFRQSQTQIIIALNQEATVNQNLSILISSRN
jgi:hypothetical protein